LGSFCWDYAPAKGYTDKVYIYLHNTFNTIRNLYLLGIVKDNFIPSHGAECKFRHTAFSRVVIDHVSNGFKYTTLWKTTAGSTGSKISLYKPVPASPSS